jgi:hypothetical protein
MPARDLANPAPVRGFSDWLDNKMNWHGAHKTTSSTRGIVHGVWHAGAGVVKSCGVTQSSRDEFTRAGEQFAKVGGAPGTRSGSQNKH